MRTAPCVSRRLGWVIFTHTKSARNELLWWGGTPEGVCYLGEGPSFINCRGGRREPAPGPG